MEGDMVIMQDVFVFERSGIDEGGHVRGVFHSMGGPPQFADRLATAGCRLRPEDLRVTDGGLANVDL